MSLDIVYEDADCLVINKPTGLTVHKTSPDDPQITVVDLLLEKYPEIAGIGDHSMDSANSPQVNTDLVNSLRPGIVHRLDKETSGLMIIAKNQPAFDYLKALFKEREIKKTYLALVFGQLKNESGTIDLPLGKIGTKSTTQISGQKELTERSAITDYKVLEYYLLDPISYSLLEVSPHTGRTHQIRVHLKSIGHPIVGDKLYAGKRHLAPAGLNRLFLHAQRLAFTTPSGSNMVLEVDLPEELTNCLNSISIAR